MNLLRKIKNPELLIWLGVGLWWMINLIQAGFTELADDEAYYHMFAQRLDWGYFDHPPVTALLVYLGGFLGGEFGVRFFFTLLQPIYLYALWRIIRPEAPTVRDGALFLLISAAMPILQLYGFIAVPDGPLMLFTALFLWCYKTFTEKNNWTSALLMGICLAALAYSKYHGALVFLFTILSNLKLLKNPKFYVACLVTVILIIPHLWWQSAHDWVSFRYHLVGRNRDFQFNFVTEYLLNLFAIFNPFLFPIFLVAWWKHRATRLVDRALSCISAAFILFFLSSTVRGYVQPQWEIPATFGIIALLFYYIRQSDKLQRYTIWVCSITIALVALTRIEMIFNPLGIKFQVFDNTTSYGQLAKLADGRPIIFDGKYTAAAKYHFYTGGTGYAQPVVSYRTSHYQLLDTDTQMAGQSILAEVNEQTSGASELQLANGKTFRYVEIDPFIPTRKIAITTEGIPEQVTPGDTLNLTLTLRNPYPYYYGFGDSVTLSDSTMAFNQHNAMALIANNISTPSTVLNADSTAKDTATTVTDSALIRQCIWPVTVNMVWRRVATPVQIIPVQLGNSGTLQPNGTLTLQAQTVVPSLTQNKKYEAGIMLTNSPLCSWFNDKSREVTVIPKQ